MSKSEDYLDQLLKGVNQSEEEETDTELLDDTVLEEDLLEEDLLEEDLFGDDALEDAFAGADDLSEEFLKEFEMEMAGMDEADLPESDVNADDTSDLDALFGGLYEDESDAEEKIDTFEETEAEMVSDEDAVQEMFDALGSIVNGNDDMPDEEPVDSGVDELDFSVEDFSYDDIGSGIDSVEEAPVEAPEDDAEAQVAKILEGLDGIDLELDDFGDSGMEQTAESKANDDALLSFLAQSDMGGDTTTDADVSTDASPVVDEASEESSDDKKKKKKDKKKPAKDGEEKGFLGKLGTILFGEDDEEEEGTEKKTTQKEEQPETLEAEATESQIAEFSAGGEYDDLFKDFTTTTTNSAPVEEKPEEAEGKKKGKKKKDKPKKEKVKKEKKPKPKKEKKPKKPKVPDNTPPLPKKPVFLIFLMVGSLVALIIMGTNLLGYSNSLSNAKNAYAKKNYTEAFSYVSSLEIKENDLPLYEKYQTMALVEVELNAYETLMDGEFYDMALDSLIRGLGRAEKYREDAQTYGCINELNALELKAETILKETFNLTREEALELYNYRDRRDYSKALNELLKELGMEKVTEE